MTKDQALKLALKALKKCRYRSLADEIVDPALTAINEALAQPEQEPVAWVCYGSSDSEMRDIDFEQKDVDALPVGTMLYTTPPQRKPLTLVRIEEIFQEASGADDEIVERFARGIEAAHGIKENT